MAEVYEAVHRGLKKSVAIKVLLPDVAENEELRARFLREGELAAHTRHPHIVDVTDVGEEGGVAYLVMELLEGESLAHVVARGPEAGGVVVDVACDGDVHRRDLAMPVDAACRIGTGRPRTVGVAAVVGNPKAILFYMGALPGFFDLAVLTKWDIAAIIGISAGVTLGGNLLLALFLDRARALLSNEAALRRMNVGSGVLLVLVGMMIPFL
jgi:hypothetical protein